MTTLDNDRRTIFIRFDYCRLNIKKIFSIIELRRIPVHFVLEIHNTVQTVFKFQLIQDSQGLLKLKNTATKCNIL
ncbi:hypothetical protein BpHYR1_046116 [Brachionus plicatilis]|uniref:Uncharacterized protein n=1 Tax=Brachionus plicatilis TaxID=10195 RepID=A0A3M7QM50_BRAPC|nr:hypothetical protein BpHYR1_046116 [Brachionus plicatilis]